MNKICPFITKLPIYVPIHTPEIDDSAVLFNCIEDRCMAWVPGKSAMVHTWDKNEYGHDYIVSNPDKIKIENKPGYCKLIGEIS